MNTYPMGAEFFSCAQTEREREREREKERERRVEANSRFPKFCERA